MSRRKYIVGFTLTEHRDEILDFCGHDHHTLKSANKCLKSWVQPGDAGNTEVFVYDDDGTVVSGLHREKFARIA